MTTHRAEDVEETARIEALKTKSAPTGDRYRAEIRRRGTVLWMFPTYEVDLHTTHVIPASRIDERGLTVVFREGGEDIETGSTLPYPPVVLGEWWARWKGRRMVAAAYKRDVREQQPWVVTSG